MSYDTTKEAGLKIRRGFFEASRRIVIKVGSAVLSSGKSMNMEVIDSLSKDISLLHDSGREVVLVSSGAVAAGRQKIGHNEDPGVSLQEKQALAAIGQSHLMHLYDMAFALHNKKIAQVLLTHSDLAHRDRYLNFKNTISTLFRMGVIPIINENDTVSTEELQFGDNDNLGALVTNLIEGDMFICLTDVECLFTANPTIAMDSKPVYTVTEVTEEVIGMAGHSTSSLGTGGMRSKILAAQKVASGGGASLIGPGKCVGVLTSVYKGEMLGTFFLPRRKRLQGRKQWIAYVLKPKGKIRLDVGACRAVRNGGKSVLPSGILSVSGEFSAGESIQCVDENDTAFAVGLANYRASDIRLIQGEKSERILEILGHKEGDVIIHRDNLVVL